MFNKQIEEMKVLIDERKKVIEVLMAEVTQEKLKIKKFERAIITLQGLMPKEEEVVPTPGEVVPMMLEDLHEIF